MLFNNDLQPKSSPKASKLMSWKYTPEYGEITFIDGLYSYAMVLTRHPGEAESLVAETYVRAPQSTVRSQAQRTIKCQLFSILRETWLEQVDRMRSGTKPNVIAAGNGFRGSDGRPDTSPALSLRNRQIKRVRAAIHGLPTELREIIVLREHEQFSYKEMAGVLNCPIGTVTARLKRARASLCRRLNLDPSDV